MERELYHFNKNHDELGRFASSNGVKKAAKIQGKIEKAENKILKNQGKIDKITKSYKGSKRAQKLEMTRNRLETRKSRYADRVAKAQTKKLYEKRLNMFDKSALRKTYDLDRQISKVTAKQNRWKQKVNKLNYKNIKLQHKVDKYKNKLTSSFNQDTIDAGRMLLEEMKKGG